MLREWRSKSHFVAGRSKSPNLETGDETSLSQKVHLHYLKLRGSPPEKWVRGKKKHDLSFNWGFFTAPIFL